MESEDGSTHKNIEDLTEKYGQACNRVVSDIHLDSISQHCCGGGAWKSLATHLEMERIVVEDIDRKLRLNLNDVKRKYTLFVECVRTSIKNRGISAAELTAFLLSQSVYDYDDQDYKLFSDRKEELERAADVDKIFNILNTEYASFLNYEIFMILLRNIFSNKTRKNSSILSIYRTTLSSKRY